LYLFLATTNGLTPGFHSESPFCMHYLLIPYSFGDELE